MLGWGNNILGLERQRLRKRDRERDRQIREGKRHLGSAWWGNNILGRERQDRERDRQTDI